jgi:UDP-N-acetylglucosamine acyltransferase
MSLKIHPTAIVHPEAQLAEDVEIGPYSVVGPRVRLGSRTRLVSHVVVHGATEIGAENLLYPFSVIGMEAQHKKRQREGAGESSVWIGDKNEIREHVTIHQASGSGVTRVGSHNLLMAGCHVAHDVTLGSFVTIANGVQLAGHAVVCDYATFGGLSGVAQHVRVGESAFVAAGAMCEVDVPPFVIVQGDRARVRAMNTVGLRRRGVPEASIAALQKAFRAIFKGSLPRAEALRMVDRSDPFVARLHKSLCDRGGSDGEAV